MVAHDQDRITLTCAGCGFVISLSRFQARIQGWHLANDPPGVALCASCAPGEHVEVRQGSEPEQRKTRNAGAA